MRVRGFFSIILIGWLLVASLAACGLLRQPLATAQPTTVVTVTADQVASAMEADNFYSAYGQTTLLIEGTVASVNVQPGDLIVELATSLPTTVLCDLGSPSAAVKVGDVLTVASANPAQDVQRQPSAVMIRHCDIP